MERSDIGHSWERGLSPSRRGAGHAAILSLVAVVGMGAIAGCDSRDLIEFLGQARPWEGKGNSPQLEAVPFTVFEDDVGDKAGAERRVLIKTREAYQSYFGHAPPKTVDLPREWVVFYAAGIRPSGGFAASIHALSAYTLGNERLLQAVTRLESPGPGCTVTDALTRPHVLIKFVAPASVFNVDFSQADTVRSCGGEPTNPCAAVLCPVGTECVVRESLPPQVSCVPIVDACAAVRCAKGTHCEVEQVQCVRAPCPPVARCVPDAPPVRCGGIAGLRCPGQGTCVDDPSDSCQPGSGADCGGLCACRQTKRCQTGTRFDASARVCDCVAVK